MAHAFDSGEQQGNTFKKRLIIVEDDPSNAEVLSMLLDTENRYQVTSFRNGSEVLANVDTLKSLKPALFLLDYQLPQMTALDLYRQLCVIEGLENVPTLVLSGSTISDEEKDRLAQSGLILVPKPYDIGDLLATIKQMVV